MSTIIWAAGLLFLRYQLAFIILFDLLQISNHILKYTVASTKPKKKRHRKYVERIAYDFQDCELSTTHKIRVPLKSQNITVVSAYLCSFFKLFNSASSFLKLCANKTIY